MPAFLLHGKSDAILFLSGTLPRASLSPIFAMHRPRAIAHRVRLRAVRTCALLRDATETTRAEHGVDVAGDVAASEGVSHVTSRGWNGYLEFADR